MGGGGGGGVTRIGKIEELDKQAKKALEHGNRKNVFISFAYEDIDEVNLLRGQSKNELSAIAFNDWSVSDPINSKKADYIKKQISERINRSSATIIYISKDTSKSKWVEWEVNESIKLGKKVIGVFKGNKRPPIPKFMSANKIKAIPWSKLAVHLSKI